MRHIVATGCGFTLSGKELPVPGTSAYIYGGTYSCTGIPKFNPAYQYTEIVPGGTNSMDNYYNLPQKIKGFIMTLNPVIKMDQITVPGTGAYATPVAPEVSCTKDADPLDPTAVANEDYTDYYLEYTDSRLYVEVEGRTYGGYAGMWDVNYTDVNRVTFELKPGALEPMIDTMFPPVGVNLPTIPDLRTTGGFVLNKLTNSWHTLIEGTLSDLYNRINSIHTDTSTADGLINLENAKNMEGACENFQIQVIEGSTVIGTELTYPVYAVSGGTVRVEESVFEVEGYTMTGQIFDSYLEVYKEDDEYKGRVMETPPGVIPDMISGYPHEGHAAYEFIGSVRKVTAAANSPRETSERLSEYVINQADCIYEIILGGTGGGSTVTEIYEYDGPFKVICDSSNTRVLNSTLSTDGTLIAGLVFECGVSVGTGAVTTIDLGSADSDVYAVVTKGTTTTVVDGSTITGATWSVGYATAPELGDNIYNVRLGHVMITGGQTITIPTEPKTTTIDLTGHTAGETVTGTIEGGDTIAVYISSIVYYAGTVDTAKIPVQVGVMVNGETYSVVPEREYKYAQYHAGDIYIDTECQEIPEPPKPSNYNGPFMLTSEGLVTCGVCPTEGTGTSAKHVAGYYSVNGTGFATVYDTAVELTGDTTSVFFNISGSGASIETTGCTTADCYSVWLGDITGATVATTTYTQRLDEDENPVLDENDEPIIDVTNTYDGATGVRQYQYGNIHVDGRWT